MESGPGSSWLQEDHRLGPQEALMRIVEAGGDISPAFSIPWVSLSTLRLDWLHIADQGVAPVFMGGLFHLFLADPAQGANENARLVALWGLIQAFYEREGVQDRLYSLTKTMVKPKKGSIELSGSGAQIRALIPFCLQLVNTWELPLDLERFSARAAMRHLSRCYSFLPAEDVPPGPGSLIDSALAYHTSVRALHEIHPKRWQLRPKLHLFMELCLEPGPPSSSWNYREESYGGSVSRQAHHRGGLATLLSMSRSTLAKFCAKEALPRLQP